jgi:hypothetical protein
MGSSRSPICCRFSIVFNCHLKSNELVRNNNNKCLECTGDHLKKINFLSIVKTATTLQWTTIRYIYIVLIIVYK